jgi:hypothetical protein
MKRTAALALVALASLAGCAPDSFRRKPEFEAWTREVRTACYRASIGVTSVGSLLAPSGSHAANHFMNETSRLYHGWITPDQWTTRVLAFIPGRRTDPGIACVLERLPETQPPPA